MDEICTRKRVRKPISTIEMDKQGKLCPVRGANNRFERTGYVKVTIANASRNLTNSDSRFIGKTNAWVSLIRIALTEMNRRNPNSYNSKNRTGKNRHTKTPFPMVKDQKKAKSLKLVDRIGAGITISFIPGTEPCIRFFWIR
jgi:hypothetical protein